MTTFDSTITRAETDLAHVQSALDTAQQVLEVADRAHSVGRRLLRMIRAIAIVFAIAGVLVAVVVLFDRLWRGFHREDGDETTEVTGSSPVLGPSGKREPPDATPGDLMQENCVAPPRHPRLDGETSSSSISCISGSLGRLMAVWTNLPPSAG